MTSDPGQACREVPDTGIFHDSFAERFSSESLAHPQQAQQVQQVRVREDNKGRQDNGV